MNSGFEDCTNLLKLIDEGYTWEKSLSEYDKTQRPNANAIADMAIENWVEMSEKVGDPKFLLRKKVESVIEKHFPDIFKSRYGMVTYTLIPYHLVQKAGVLQEKIFKELCADLTSGEAVSLEAAKGQLEKYYVPFLKEHNIQLDSFVPV